MPEDDQVKWVGVRPVNPPESIPVDIASSTGCAKVAPCTAFTEFQTLTRKRTPAIGDLQAVTGFVRFTEKKNNVGAAYDHILYTVPDGKMFRLEYIMGMAWQVDPTGIYFSLRVGATDYQWYYSAYGAAFEMHRQTLPIIYDQGEKVVINWVGTGATTDVTGGLFGHLVDRYS